MKTYLQILSQHSLDVYPSILVHFDSQRYLFNCGEGTQRLVNEYKIRMGKIRDIFLTRVHWDCTGGLPGMALTCADASASSTDDYRGGFQVHGPKNTTHFLNSTRHFIIRKQFPLNTREYGQERESDGLFFRDKNLKITAFPIMPSFQQSNAEKQRSLSLDSGIQTRKRKASEDSLSKSSYEREKSILGSIFNTINNDDGSRKENDVWHKSLPNCKPDYTSLCYFCDGPTVPPKFDADKAKQLNIPKGPQRAKLVRGESITLEDGTVVSPSDVCTAAEEFTSFMILDIPSTDYIHSLVNNKDLSAKLSLDRLGCVVHIVDDGVLESEEYQRWIKNSFKEHVNHLICARSYNKQSVIFRSAARQQRALGKVDSDVYVLPYANNQAEKRLDDLKHGLHLIPAECLLRFELEPKPCRVSREECPEPVKISRSRKRLQSANNTTASDINVRFLGTGSMAPSKYRNVSGISLSFGSRGNVLMDTGEGTMGQLVRMLGPEQAREYLRRLRAIFISHLHADHHLGIVRIIQEYNKLATAESTLNIIAPKGMWSFLTEYSQCQPLMLSERIKFTNAALLSSLKHNQPQTQQQEPKYSRELKSLLGQLGLEQLKTFPVVHCPHAYGVYMQTAAGSSGINKRYGITYSGDTRPCDALVETSTRPIPISSYPVVCDEYHGLLIHEATFGNDMQQEAIDRKHSTTGEAIEIARRMKAKELLLTHFSQRYPKTEDMRLSDDDSDELNIGIAVDMMQVRVGDVGRLKRSIGALESSQLSAESDSASD